MKSRKILVWFRNDLRLHDNEMLVEAIAKSNEILPVYIFDPRTFQLSVEPPVFKSGNIRTRFLQESVAALRKSFQQLGGNLLVLNGHPEDILPDLVEQYDIAEVYHHREVASAETIVSAEVEDRLWKIQVNLRHFIGHTLYNKEDLPFPIKDIPDVFAQFKKKTERDAIVKACFLAPEVINFTEVDDWGLIPDLQTLLQVETLVEPVKHELIGGEQAGLQHLRDLLAPGAAIYLKPAKTSAGKAGFSSRLSPWLAVGCLSPRMVYWMVKDAEEEHGGHANFNQIILGLLWRDYFRFMLKKHGFSFFEELAEPPAQVLTEAEENSLLKQWKSGATGHVLVDEYMQQLNETGFVTNTGRVLLATYLIYVLKVNWMKGAAYFEEKSIDYAPANNWCNWAIVAGAGKAGHASKSTFNLDKQLKMLDINVPI